MNRNVEQAYDQGYIAAIHAVLQKIQDECQCRKMKNYFSGHVAVERITKTVMDLLLQASSQPLSQSKNFGVYVRADGTIQSLTFKPWPHKIEYMEAIE